MTKAIILIEVQGGMAEVVGCSKDIQFEIRDLDGGEGREGHEDAFSKKQIKEAINSGIGKVFPNGFASWQETHFEVVQALTEAMTAEDLEPEFKNAAVRRSEAQGTGGLYEMAEELTDEFEKKYEGKEWDGEFFDAMQEFLREKLQ